MKYFKYIITCIFLWVKPLQAQVIDEIICKVDDYIILKSDLEIAYNQVRRGGQYGNAELKCQVLENLIINKMLRVQAELDSLVIEDAMVDAELSRKIMSISAQYGGEEELEKIYGKSMDQIRNEIREEQKEMMMTEQARASIIGNITITPQDVRKFYHQIPKDSLPLFSAEVEVAQIVKLPEVGRDMKNRVKANLIDIKQQILDGQVTFEEMARKYSMDPGSASRGGDLGFAKRGQMVSEFEAAALKLKPGEISNPIESDFGIHLIKLEERRGNEYNARHILISPETSYRDVEKTRMWMDSLRNEIVSGNISFQKAAKEYSDDRQTKGNGGFFQDVTGSSYVPFEELDPVIFFSIDTMQVGDISPAIVYKRQDGSQAVRLLYYKDKKKPHRANINDDYQKLAYFARNQKEQLGLVEWFETAKTKMYINIDERYNYCDILK